MTTVKAMPARGDDSARSSARPIALITGSTRGIGFGVAQGLLHRGFDVVVNGRTVQATNAACEELRAWAAQTVSGAVYAAPFDVTDAHAVQTAIGTVEQRHGPITALVNNAGVLQRFPLLDGDLAQWDRCWEVSVVGAVTVTRCVVPSMVTRRTGKIVNICSVQTMISRPGLGAYAAAKAGLAALTRTMCAEWAQFGIQVNALAPGYVKTDMTTDTVAAEGDSDWVVSRTPSRRWGTVDDIVGPVLWLCSPESAFVNGQTIYVDGGITAVV